MRAMTAIDDATDDAPKCFTHVHVRLDDDLAMKHMRVIVANALAPKHAPNTRRLQLFESQAHAASVSTWHIITKRHVTTCVRKLT